MDATQERPDVRGAEGEPEQEHHRVPEAVEALADGKKVTGEQIIDATEWFLSDDLDDEAPPTKTLELRVKDADPEAGTSDVWVRWKIRPLDADEMKKIQRQAGGNRSQRRSQQAEGVDATQANLLMVVEATVEPDLRAAALAKNIQDATYVLKHRLRFKPGLIQQIAGEVLLFSGFDDEDVRDSVEVRAAGN